MHGTASEYDRSLRAVAGRMGVELKEVPQWVCCGATSAHAVDAQTALCLAADTLAKAQGAGMERVLAPCAMCYQRLAAAACEMSHERELGVRVAMALGEKPDLAWEKVKPLSVLGWLEGVGDEELAGLVNKPLKGLKVACYYGCLLVRPAKLTGVDNVEAPRSMERLVKLAGAEPVRWSMALECCGGSFALSRKGVVLRQGRRIYDAARRVGADVIVLACPMCHANLDLRQAAYAKGEAAVPVLYLTQLLGLAMGVDEDDLGLDKHFVPVSATLEAALARPQATAVPAAAKAASAAAAG